MRTKQKLRRIVLLSVIVAGALALSLFSRRAARRSVGELSRAPAGATASTEGTRVMPSGDSAATEVLPARTLVEDERRYEVRVWSFALNRYELRIEDAGMTTALDAVLTRSGAELVVDGGFFDPEGKPVGLAISEGTVLSRLAKRLSGGVLTSDGTRAELFPAEGFVRSDGDTFAIQCRPRLVVERNADVKSNDGKHAERTALCTRNAGRTVDVVIVRGGSDGESSGPSLFALARHLAEAGCESALNLDGGPSTGVAWRERDAVKLLAPRGPVRHGIAFLTVKERR